METLRDDVRYALRNAMDDLLVQTGLSVSDLARRSGLNRAAISRLASGYTIPNLVTFAILCRIADDSGLLRWGRALLATLNRLYHASGQTRIGGGPTGLTFVDPIDVALIEKLRDQSVPWRKMPKHFPALRRVDGTKSRPSTAALQKAWRERADD